MKAGKEGKAQRPPELRVLLGPCINIYMYVYTVCIASIYQFLCAYSCSQYVPHFLSKDASFLLSFECTDTNCLSANVCAQTKVIHRAKVLSLWFLFHFFTFIAVHIHSCFDTKPPPRLFCFSSIPRLITRVVHILT